LTPLRAILAALALLAAAVWLREFRQTGSVRLVLHRDMPGGCRGVWVESPAGRVGVFTQRGELVAGAWLGRNTYGPCSYAVGTDGKTVALQVIRPGDENSLRKHRFIRSW
jgi:hypothetical protein